MLYNNAVPVNSDINSVINTILSMTIFKNIINNNDSSSNQSNIWDVLKILLMTIFITMIKEFPKYVKIIINYFNMRLKTNTKTFLENSTIINHKTIKGSIQFNISAYNFNYKQNAILHMIAKLDSALNIAYYKDELYVLNVEPFEITQGIFVQVKDCPLEILKLEDLEYKLILYSYTYGISEINKYLEELVEEYEYDKNNRLGKHLYFLNQNSSTKLNQDQLTFKISQFHSNKSLSNIYGKHLKIVRDRIELFTTRKDWYEVKGIPYTLGILIHGPPGTGKTSLIKAIAKDTNRHIINLKLNSNINQSAMDHVFYNNNLITSGLEKRNESIKIPNNKRLYIIEDIDALGDIVCNRSFNNTKKNEDNNIEYRQNNNSSKSMKDKIFKDVIYGHSYNDILDSNSCDISYIYPNETTIEPKVNKNDEETKNEQVTLAYLLNLLDGIQEIPGRIIIMSTNHREKLDPALIRPGRIDIDLLVTYCDIEMIQEIFINFFKTECLRNPKKFNFSNNVETDKILEVTPAEVMRVLQNNYDSCENAFQEMLKLITG